MLMTKKKSSCEPAIENTGKTPSFSNPFKKCRGEMNPQRRGREPERVYNTDNRSWMIYKGLLRGISLGGLPSCYTALFCSDHIYTEL
jgi:hypothetical protein